MKKVEILHYRVEKKQKKFDIFHIIKSDIQIKHLRLKTTAPNTSKITNNQHVTTFVNKKISITKYIYTIDN